MEQGINNPRRETMLKSGTRAAYEAAESQSSERVIDMESRIKEDGAMITALSNLAVRAVAEGWTMPELLDELYDKGESKSS